MRMSGLHTALATASLALAVTACVGQPSSPALAPLAAKAPSTDAVTLQAPLTVGLVWVKQADAAKGIPDRGKQETVEKIRSEFSESDRALRISSADTVSSLDSAALRQLGQGQNAKHFLLVAPTVREVKVPARLRLDGGRSNEVVGTRTETYVVLEAVGIDVATGSSLFVARGEGIVTLEAVDSGPLGPWYPRIVRGASQADTGPIIYPDGDDFPPGEVRVVGLRLAVAKLVSELKKVRVEIKS